jgi:hypothetical protein
MPVKTETFTPGPWDARLRYVESKYNGQIASCEAGTVRPYEIAEANARLIAAAPELLECVQQVLIASDDGGNMDDINWKALQTAVNKALGR